MRRVADTLDRLDLAWFITGSEALAAYGTPRQTMDVDVVVDGSPDALSRVARSLESSHYFSEPLRLGNRWLASLIDREGGGKVDLIVRDADAWGHEAFARRREWNHPTWARVWVSSMEDLVLAKLEWSEGSSELQLRDCRTLLRMNAVSVDRAYLARWSRILGVERLLLELSEYAGDET